jgi:glyoxylase I family protein
MTRFVRDVLGLEPASQSEVDADVFDLSDGSTFMVASAAPAEDERTVGFSVEDLDAAIVELRAAGVEVDDAIAANERFRYVHFRAPDRRLYELVEVRRAIDRR